MSTTYLTKPAQGKFSFSCKLPKKKSALEVLIKKKKIFNFLKRGLWKAFFPWLELEKTKTKNKQTNKQTKNKQTNKKQSNHLLKATQSSVQIKSLILQLVNLQSKEPSRVCASIKKRMLGTDYKIRSPMYFIVYILIFIVTLFYLYFQEQTASSDVGDCYRLFQCREYTR